MAAFTETFSEQFGRHLIAAAADLAPGQPVLQQQPYAAVLYDDQVSQRCDWCFASAAPGSSLLRCSRSQLAHYCSQEHQRAAWRAYYRDECAALVACAPHVPPATVRLAARVLWRRAREQQQQQQQQQQQKNQPASSGQPQPGTQQRLQQQLAGGMYGDVHQLLSHWDDLDAARKIQYAQMAVLTRQYMLGTTRQQQQPPPPAATAAGGGQAASDQARPPPTATPASSSIPETKCIAQLLARLACNNHTVCDDELRAIGVGLYPLAALVNHACRPNCAQGFVGCNIVFRCLQPIPAGQQLTISYIEMAATRQERRRQLLQHYFFDIDAPEPQDGQHSHQQESAGLAAATAAAVQPSATDKGRPPPSSSAPAPAAAAAPAVVVAAAAGSSAGQVEGVAKLQLLCKLPGPGVPQQQVQRHVQAAAAAAAGTATGGGGGAEGATCLLPLTCYMSATCAANDRPSSSATAAGCKAATGGRSIVKGPWPEDAADRQLCEVMQLVPAAKGHVVASSSGSRLLYHHQPVTLPGGMCLLPVLQHAGQAAGGAGAADADAAAAAMLFKDLEGLEMQVDEAMDADGDSDELSGAGVTKSGSHEAQLQQQQPAAQTRLQLEAVQWGDWGGAVTNRGGISQRVGPSHPDQVQTADVAVAAAGVLLGAWSMLQQADRAAAEGHAAAAVHLYRQAMAVADGAAPGLTLQVSLVGSTAIATAPSTATATDELAAGATGTHNSSNGSNGSSLAAASVGGVRVVLGWLHVLRGRITAGLLKAAVDAGEWPAALEAARALVPFYRLVYPKVWPNLGLHYATLAKLEMLLEQPAAAAQAAEAALAILQVTHGSGSSVMSEVMQTRFEAAQELAAASAD